MEQLPQRGAAMTKARSETGTPRIFSTQTRGTERLADDQTRNVRLKGYLVPKLATMCAGCVFHV